MENRDTSEDEERLEAIRLEDMLGNWPRRLLHVPTMTSCPWQPGNRYLDAVCPRYNAISYTWGRFRLEDHEQAHVKALEVRGVSWAIPRVNPSHFDTSSLSRALDAARCIGAQDPENDGRVDFIWIDIACINQQFTIDSMLEIGRQAKIFNNAQNVYIWLNSMTEAELLDSQTLALKWSSNAFTRDEHKAIETLETVKRLKDEPWFSSIWTLQEGYLRSDAILISKETHPIWLPQSYKQDFEQPLTTSHQRCRVFTLKHLVDGLGALYKDFWIDGSEGYHIREYLKIIGATSLNRRDAMGLIETASLRKPEKQLDSVYGIQQIFNVRVGSTNPHAQRGRHFTLEDLWDELGAALMTADPVLSQSFVHSSSTPLIGKRWRADCDSVGQGLVSSEDMPWRSRKYHPECTLGTKQCEGKLWGRFDGRVCDFKRLKTTSSNRYQTRRSSGESLSQPPMFMGLDVGTVIFARLMSSVFMVNEWNDSIATRLAEIDDPNINYDSPGLGSIRVLHLGSNTTDELYECHIGLIIFRPSNDTPDFWLRIGLCAWLGYFAIDYGQPEDVNMEVWSTRNPDMEGVRSDSPPQNLHPRIAIDSICRNELGGTSEFWKSLSGFFG